MLAGSQTKMRSRAFKDPKQLEKLYTLRSNGVRITVLAEMFNCDRSTIHWHLRKKGVKPVKLLAREKGKRRSPNAPPPYEQIVVNGEKLSIGRDYKDYLKDDLAKRQKERAEYLKTIGFTGK